MQTYVTPFDYNPRDTMPMSPEENQHPLYREEIAQFERMHNVEAYKERDHEEDVEYQERLLTQESFGLKPQAS